MENQRLLIILDLDETLIRATSNPTLDPVDFMIDLFRVRRRPSLEDFLMQISEFADLGIWSSGSDSYVSELVEQIIPKKLRLQFAWGRSRCTRQYDSEHQEEYWVKDLKKVKRLGYSLKRVLIVDDTREKVERNYGNHVHIDPFYGDLEDSVLKRLALYLRRFIETPDVRTVEKRGWINSLSDDKPA